MQIHGSPLNGCRNMEKTVRWFFLGEPGCNQGNSGQQKKGKPRLREWWKEKEVSYRLEPLPMIAGKLRNRVQLLLLMHQ